MRHEVSLFAAILLLSYGLAFWASKPAPDAESAKQTIFRMEADDIVALRYVEQDLTVEVTRRDPVQGGFWVTHKKTTTPPANPHTPQDETASKPLPETITTTFKANEKLQENVLASLAPFEAVRVVGKVADDVSSEFGFEEGNKTFVVEGKGRTHTFALGKKSYGSRNRFVKADDGRVLLVDDGVFETMEKANLRMFERRLVSFADDDVSHATIRGSGGEKRMAHTVRDAKGNLSWSDAGPDAQIKTTYQSWMDKISRLRLMNYAEPEREQELAGVEPFLVVAYEKDGKPLDTVAFKKLAASGQGDGKAAVEYWATSTYLGVHASLSENRVAPIEADAAMIME